MQSGWGADAHAGVSETSPRPPRFACKGISISREIAAFADVLCRATVGGDKWVYSIIFRSKYFEGLLCAIVQRREGSRAVLVLWPTPACPIGDRAAQSLATVFASCLFIHRFAGKRFSFATEKHGGLAFSEAELSTKKHYLCILAHTSKVRTPSIVSFATIIPHLITF